MQFVCAKALWSSLPPLSPSPCVSPSSPWWCRERRLNEKAPQAHTHKKKKKKRICLSTRRCSIWKHKNKSFFLCGRCELDVTGRGEWGFSPSPGIHWTNRCVVCVLLYNLFFSHTDLVPVVGPGSKDLVTTPIIGLRSLNNNTIQPLVYPHSLAPCLSSSQQNNRQRDELRDERVSPECHVRALSGSTGRSNES